MASRRRSLRARHNDGDDDSGEEDGGIALRRPRRRASRGQAVPERDLPSDDAAQPSSPKRRRRSNRRGSPRSSPRSGRKSPSRTPGRGGTPGASSTRHSEERRAVRRMERSDQAYARRLQTSLIKSARRGRGGHQASAQPTAEGGLRSRPRRAAAAVSIARTHSQLHEESLPDRKRFSRDEANARREAARRAISNEHDDDDDGDDDDEASEHGNSDAEEDSDGSSGDGSNGDTRRNRDHAKSPVLRRLRSSSARRSGSRAAKSASSRRAPRRSATMQSAQSNSSAGRRYSLRDRTAVQRKFEVRAACCVVGVVKSWRLSPNVSRCFYNLPPVSPAVVSERV